MNALITAAGGVVVVLAALTVTTTPAGSIRYLIAWRAKFRAGLAYHRAGGRHAAPREDLADAPTVNLTAVTS